MHVDTDAIRSYGRGTSELGADIHDAANTLTAVSAPAVTAALGEVGTRFAAALAEAAADLAHAMSRIGDVMTSSAAATAAAARDYDDVEQRSRSAIARVEA
jgi:hypothetical protein